MRYNLQRPETYGFAGWNNYFYFYMDPGFWPPSINTLILVIGVLIITVVGGILLGNAARPADFRAGHRAHPGDLALLRHAAGRGAGVEEHDPDPELRRGGRHSEVLRGSVPSTGSRNIRCSRSS